MDFYTLLYETISKDDNKIKMNMDLSLCLITDEPLEEHSITLYCGHSFNYEPLYKEVIQQKRNKISNEIKQLRHHEIKCPYCRNVQRGILPLHPSFESIYGVNLPEELSMFTKKCCYVFRSGKRKGQSCNKLCLKTYCNTCDSVIKKREKTKKENEQIKNDGMFCKAILKSGKRKGLYCEKSIKDNFLCGRHCSK